MTMWTRDTVRELYDRLPDHHGDNVVDLERHRRARGDDRPARRKRPRKPVSGRRWSRPTDAA